MVRAHGQDYRRTHRPSAAQERVLRHIAVCRTAALGGHLDACGSCGHVRVSYNSCRDRHCPKCQGPERAAWLAKRLERLLPVPYFHVVFTIPHDLNALALGNKKTVFDILFRTASGTLAAIAGDPKFLGAQPGITCVLHTWGQNLLFHPNLHCVVTGGGLSPDGARWVSGRDDYFLPVKVLSALFRGKFMAALQQAYRNGALHLGGSTAELARPQRWAAFRDGLYRKNWVVYAKRPFGGPEQVMRYLGRYTHRVAIGNHRIVDFANGKVTFALKDYKDAGKNKRMTLDAVEFLRRFPLHVLPQRFVRIRHYGLCAGRNVTTRLAAARRLLQPDLARTDGALVLPDADPEHPWWQRFLEATGVDVMACPRCHTGRLTRIETLPPSAQPAFANGAHALREPP